MVTGRAILVICGGVALLGAAAWANSPQAKTDAEQAAFFESRIRPILFENCFSCHAEKDQKGGLRLDSRDALMKGGSRGATLVAGDPEKSLFVQAISHAGPLRMPPAGKLKEADISALTVWVKMGAPWPDAKPVPASGGSNGRTSVVTAKHRKFWSFQPVRAPKLPAVKNTAWARTPIDRFILAKLEAKGLRPAPPADRRSLIRRAYIDLLGLPPTPEEVEAFVNDRSPNAWEKVVDGLLASPHYGERWGRHWLDLARYADSNGLDENKAFANAWRYRDYVVNAFNKDKPYDRFLCEQLAGDLMPAATPEERNEQITATGFLVLGPKVLAEQDKPKMVMDIVDEQIEVMSKSMMGLTVACARCHDHKFDPIPTADYYALAGIFKSTKTMKDLGFVSNWNERPLASPEYDAKVSEHKKRMEVVEAKRKAARDAANAEVLALIRRDAEKLAKAGWEITRQPGVVSLAEAPKGPGDRRIFLEAEEYQRGNLHKDFEAYGKGIGVIHNVGLPDEAEWDLTVPAAGDYQVELRYASADPRPVKLILNGRVIRESCAAQVTGSFQPDGQRWEVAGRFPFSAGKNTLRIETADHPIPHFDKILVAPAPAPIEGVAPRTADEIAQQYGVNVDLARRFSLGLIGVKSEADALAVVAKTELGNGVLGLPEKPELLYSPAQAVNVKTAEEAVKAEAAKAPAMPVAMAVEDDRVEDCKIHIRGDTEKLGALSPRSFVTVLTNGPSPNLPKDRSGRLELAQWLANPRHPMTARVAVNRIWQGHFGEGLVRTPDNWGFLGEAPTHPELLDWLAAAFSSGPTTQRPNDPATQLAWSQKKLHKLIMLSSVYQMSVLNPTSERLAATVDPDNRLLWKMPRRRMEAEPFRDSILAVAGTLDETMGGNLLTTPNNDYVTNDQSGNGARYSAPRRSIYLPIIRNALFDMFQAFDVGDPSIVNAKRPSTTIAPQALWVMNSPFAVEQSRAFAERLLKLNDSDSQRIRRAYLSVFSRPPVQSEVSRDLAFVERYSSRLAAKEPDGAKRRLKAWSALCHTLFASNEFIYLN
jgi:cytochrome c553